MAIKKFRVIDSHLNIQYNRHTVWSVSYEPTWQALRLSLSFKDHEKIRYSFIRLRAYLNTPIDTYTERLFRIRNLVCALPVGQTSQMGISYFDNREIDQIVLYRDSISDLYLAVIQVEPLTFWDWHNVRLRLHSLWKTDPATSILIYRNLTGERSFRMNRAPKRELRHFILLLKESIYES